MGDKALYERDGHVATITYNRPDVLNAIDAEMREDLNDCWLRFRDDTEAWVGIVTGAGRAFCAGADLRNPAGSAGTWPATFWEIPTINSFESGLEVFKPTVAAVNGHCLGYGLTAVTACDFVIASEDATFGFPEVRIGTPTIVGAIRTPGKIGWQNAMELLLTGESVDAERAKEMGLVWKVVPKDRVMDEARALAERLTKAAPLAQRATKEMAYRSRFMGWTEAVRMGETMRRHVARTEDAAEGRAAATEGREPDWKGR